MSTTSPLLCSVSRSPFLSTWYHFRIKLVTTSSNSKTPTERLVMHPWTPNRLISPRVARSVATECKICVNRVQLLDPSWQVAREILWHVARLLCESLWICWRRKNWRCITCLLPVSCLIVESWVWRTRQTLGMSSVFWSAAKNWVTKANKREICKKTNRFLCWQPNNWVTQTTCWMLKLLLCVAYITFLVICRVYSFKKIWILNCDLWKYSIDGKSLYDDKARNQMSSHLHNR